MPVRSPLRVPKPSWMGGAPRADDQAPPTATEGAPEVLPGAFIVLEGIDGTGKSHIAARVVAHLATRGITAISTSEPTEGPTGRLLRQSASATMEPYEELFLFLTDRTEHTRWIRERLAEGNWVVCDRYAMSSAAYQGTALEAEWEAKGQDSVKWIMDLQRPWWLEPDLTVLIVDDVDRCLARVSDRGSPSKFERRAYLERVQRNYLRLAETLDRVAVVDEPELERLLEAVLGRVEALLGSSQRV